VVDTFPASQVRADLVRALEVDLIGPSADHEKLDRAPSRLYLTGFLVSREGCAGATQARSRLREI